MKLLKWFLSLFRKDENKTVPKDERHDIRRVVAESKPERIHVQEESKEQEKYEVGEDYGEQLILMTKNEYRKIQLLKGFEARYSGNTKQFYLHKINYPCTNQ